MHELLLPFVRLLVVMAALFCLGKSFFELEAPVKISTKLWCVVWLLGILFFFYSWAHEDGEKELAAELGYEYVEDYCWTDDVTEHGQEIVGCSGHWEKI